MTELAYMVRQDWGQHGTGMVTQSALIRQWLAAPRYLFAVPDAKKFSAKEHPGDYEVAEFIAPDPTARAVINLHDLSRLVEQRPAIGVALIAVHPFKEHELAALAAVTRSGVMRKLFVMVWAPTDLVRTWLDGHDALNLHAESVTDPPDPVMLEAAREMVRWQYNGLSSGRGKDTVVQLVRAFARAGYPVEAEAWLRVFFAAGGDFRHAESVKKLIGEMQRGVNHRVKELYKPTIVDVLRERAR